MPQALSLIAERGVTFKYSSSTFRSALRAGASSFTGQAAHNHRADSALDAGGWETRKQMCCRSD